MKNFYYLLSITLFVAVFVSCESKINKPDDRKGDSFDGLIKKHIISVDQSIAMYQEYENKRAKLVGPLLEKVYEDTSFVDTKFVSFSLEDIKEYLAFIEQIQQENPEQNISGLRFYFAAYPNAESDGFRKIKNPRQQTVFIAPTVDAGNLDSKYKSLNHLPFYIKGTKENPLKGDFVVIEELMSGYNKKERLNTYNVKNNISKASFGLNMPTLIKIEGTSPIFNEGEMVPPPVR